MLKKLFYLLPLSLAFVACNSQHGCDPGPGGCGQLYTFKQAGYCPHGYMFVDENKEEVFIDYFAYPSETIDEAYFKELKKGDQVFMDIEIIDKSDWAYHLIDYICKENTKNVGDIEQWAQVTCFTPAIFE